MASPHIAGIAAPSNPLAYGAGHVRPANAYDPGLVYDSGPEDWLKWICGTYNDLSGIEKSAVSCEDLAAALGTADPSDLNYGSIAVGDLAAKQTYTAPADSLSARDAGLGLPAGYGPRHIPLCQRRTHGTERGW